MDIKKKPTVTENRKLKAEEWKRKYQIREPERQGRAGPELKCFLWVLWRGNEGGSYL